MMAWRRKAEQGIDLRLDLSVLLLRAMRDMGWSQAKVAERSGLSESVVSLAVHGQRDFRLSTVARLLAALKIDARIAGPGDDPRKPRAIARATTSPASRIHTQVSRGSSNVVAPVMSEMIGGWEACNA